MRLARDLAASAANPDTSWCFSVTDSRGRAKGHACARPEPRSQAPPGPDPPGFALTRTGPGPPGGYGTWRFTTGLPGQQAWIFTIDPIPTGDCDHRYAAAGHDPGVKLRHLTQIRHATCTGPRRDLHLDHPERTHLHHRTHRIPDIKIVAEVARAGRGGCVI
jgi:hypothetical protein